MLAVVRLVAWNVSLQLKFGDPSHLADEQRELIAAVAFGGRVVELAGTEAAPAPLPRGKTWPLGGAGAKFDGEQLCERCHCMARYDGETARP